MSGGSRWPVRGYRALLHLYPRRFRAEYGDAMTSLVAAQLRDEPTTRVVARIALDLVITVPVQHLEVHVRAPRPLVPVGSAAVALAGFGVAVAAGTGTFGVVVGLLVALAASAVAVVSWRQSRVVGGVRSEWWKPVAVGVVLVVAVVVGARAGLEAWYLGIGMVVAGVALVATGLVLGVLAAWSSLRSA